MALVVNTVGDYPQQPGVYAETYVPDQLIAGDLKVVSQPITVTGGASLPRGTVLGKISLGAASSAAKGGGNTGTGTLVLDGATPILANATVGVYSVVCIAAGANSATFRVTDPKGVVLGDVAFNGAGASATFADRIKFAVTDAGTDFIVGDAFNVTIAAGSGKYKLAVKTAVDGSAAPAAILCDTADATSGDVASGGYFMGEFNQNAISYDNSYTLSDLQLIMPPGIFLKSAVLASDPT